MKVIANFGVLMKLASELGKARVSGDEERIKKAEMEHDQYRDICLKADEIIIGVDINDRTKKKKNPYYQHK